MKSKATRLSTEERAAANASLIPIAIEGITEKMRAISGIAGVLAARFYDGSYETDLEAGGGKIAALFEGIEQLANGAMDEIDELEKRLPQVRSGTEHGKKKAA